MTSADESLTIAVITHLKIGYESFDEALSWALEVGDTGIEPVTSSV
jgi:hypothetical protein